MRMYYTANAQSVEQWCKPFLDGSTCQFGTEGEVLIVLSRMAFCPCGRPVYFVINRDGRTRCIFCDHMYQRSIVAA